MPGSMAGVGRLVAVAVLSVTAVLIEVTVDPLGSVVITVSEDVTRITLPVGAGEAVEVDEVVKTDPSLSVLVATMTDVDGDETGIVEVVDVMKVEPLESVVVSTMTVADGRAEVVVPVIVEPLESVVVKMIVVEPPDPEPHVGQ